MVCYMRGGRWQQLLPRYPTVPLSTKKRKLDDQTCSSCGKDAKEQTVPMTMDDAPQAWWHLSCFNEFMNKNPQWMPLPYFMRGTEKNFSVGYGEHYNEKWRVMSLKQAVLAARHFPNARPPKPDMYSWVAWLGDDNDSTEVAGSSHSLSELMLKVSRQLRHAIPGCLWWTDTSKVCADTGDYDDQCKTPQLRELLTKAGAEPGDAAASAAAAAVAASVCEHTMRPICAEERNLSQYHCDVCRRAIPFLEVLSHCTKCKRDECSECDTHEWVRVPKNKPAAAATAAS